MRSFVERADHARLAALAEDYDVLVDCSDNFTTRFVVNDAAVSLGKAAVLASIYQFEGQLQVLTPGSSCLRCVWPDATRDGTVGNCAEAGVLGPVPGVLGSLQAVEVLKLLLGLPSPAQNAVVLVDLMTLETRRLLARRAPECAARDCVRVAAAQRDAEALARAPDVEVDVALLDGAERSGYVVIDLRDDVEVAAAAAPGSVVHLPLARLLENPHQLDATGRYLLLCARGARSRAAALLLRDAGFGSVWSLRGGLAARGATHTS